MKRENFRKIPDNLLPKEVRNPETSFEDECGDLTRDEILAKNGNSLEEGIADRVLKVAEDVVIEKEKEEIAAKKRAEEVVRKVIYEAEKKVGRE